jgi:hypothetical protein
MSKGQPLLSVGTLGRFLRDRGVRRIQNNNEHRPIAFYTGVVQTVLRAREFRQNLRPDLGYPASLIMGFLVFIFLNI